MTSPAQAQRELELLFVDICQEAVRLSPPEDRRTNKRSRGPVHMTENQGKLSSLCGISPLEYRSAKSSYQAIDRALTEGKARKERFNAKHG